MIGVFALWSLLVLGFFWGGCPCCETTTFQCGPCQDLWSTPPMQKFWRLEVAGITNGTESDCEVYNGTWDMEIVFNFGCRACVEVLDEESDRSILMSVFGSSGNLSINLLFNSNCTTGNEVADYTLISNDAETDCSASQFILPFDASNASCDEWPASMTINAI